MKQLMTVNGPKGPFTQITETADAYICDGAICHKSVVGSNAAIQDYDPTAFESAKDKTYKQFTSLEFFDLFTEDEQLAIANASMQSAQVKLWYDRMLAAMFITGADPRTIAGLEALQVAGLLTPARKLEVMAGLED